MPLETDLHWDHIFSSVYCLMCILPKEKEAEIKEEEKEYDKGIGSDVTLSYLVKVLGW